MPADQTIKGMRQGDLLAFLHRAAELMRFLTDDDALRMQGLHAISVEDAEMREPATPGGSARCSITRGSLATPRLFRVLDVKVERDAQRGLVQQCLVRGYEVEKYARKLKAGETGQYSGPNYLGGSSYIKVLETGVLQECVLALLAPNLRIVSMLSALGHVFSRAVTSGAAPSSAFEMSCHTVTMAGAERGVLRVRCRSGSPVHTRVAQILLDSQDRLVIVCGDSDTVDTSDPDTTTCQLADTFLEPPDGTMYYENPFDLYRAIEEGADEPRSADADGVTPDIHPQTFEVLSEVLLRVLDGGYLCAALKDMMRGVQGAKRVKTEALPQSYEKASVPAMSAAAHEGASGRGG